MCSDPEAPSKWCEKAPTISAPTRSDTYDYSNLNTYINSNIDTYLFTYFSDHNSFPNVDAKN